MARYCVHGLQWCKQHPYARHYLVKYSLQHYLVKYSLNDLCTFNLRPVSAGWVGGGGGGGGEANIVVNCMYVQFRSCVYGVLHFMFNEGNF